MKQCFASLLIYIVCLVLIAGCKHEGSEILNIDQKFPSSREEILLDAHELLGVDLTTFEQGLEKLFFCGSSPFEVESIYIPSDLRFIDGKTVFVDYHYELNGQGILIAVMLVDDVDFPNHTGKIARMIHEGLPGEQKPRELVGVIEILLPYKVSKVNGYQDVRVPTKGGRLF